MSDLLAQQLELLRARSIDRHLREVQTAQGSVIELDGKELVNFSLNDYLGLAGGKLGYESQ
jgi:8-amino-7-oxononanoate synthase